VGTICSRILFAEPHHFDKFGLLLDSLRPHEQSKLLEAMIRKLESEFLSPFQDLSGIPTGSQLGQAIGGVSAVIEAVAKDRPSIETQLHDWLVAGVGGKITSLSMRRALLAAAKRNPGMMESRVWIPVTRC
jgi:telomere length regulation protein